MTDPTTYSVPPIELPLNFPSDPAPVAGCDVCQALGGERGEARAKGDLSKVSDVNVEIRQHPHEKRRRRA
ncbi:hypothetical protein OG875_17665 [Streptomyces sp. NBC_01498]|uniref:hypothetical protein n=1 Tax=Streptomyces sp. NBC_01498 TaxID=2975870 RepID=UPI002E7B18F2|nr:hypothetical protein [Streptomyces sp. NBC_01498]WTL26251.1 hypothetical protein OG875_17665 [Streptomyces sp. NBC_01498]